MSPGDVRPFDGLDAGFLVDAPLDKSLELASALAREEAVVAASPNWHSPQESDWLVAGSQQDFVGEGGLVADGITSAQRTYCSGLAPMADWKYSDPLHLCAWHLDADTGYTKSGVDPSVDINIGNVWDTTMGAGVTVAIVDNHWNGNHEDLSDNVDAQRSTNWGETSEPFKLVLEPCGGGQVGFCLGKTITHGTLTAGVVGARDNTLGSRGVAPRASLVNFNHLDDEGQHRIVDAWTLHSDVVGVSTHGYSLSGPGLRRGGGFWWYAVDSVLASGLDGKGTVFTKSAGNDNQRAGHQVYASHEEQNNHRGVMTICAVGPDGTHSSYSEMGPNLWLCAPSTHTTGGPGILSTEGSNGYDDTFGGTSASAPQVAGVAALVRAANSSLTWRDIKLILADTASKNDSSDSSWMAGASKYSDSNSTYSYSHKYGFGLVDAKAAVDKASSWTLLPVQKSHTAVSTGLDTVLKDDTRTTNFSLNVATGIDFVEHVNLELDMRTDNFRDFTITLVSPAGRESVISPYYQGCSEKCQIYGMFAFAATRHLGEDPNGTWKLRFDYGPSLQTDPTQAADKATVKSWKLRIYGHTKTSTPNKPYITLTVGPDDAQEVTVDEGDSFQVAATLHNGTLTADLIVPLEFIEVKTLPFPHPKPDFTLPARVTIQAGTTTGSGSITTTFDQDTESVEKFEVRVGALDGYDFVGPGPIVIIEEPPVITISPERGPIEGFDAIFLITASPFPDAWFDQEVDISATGGFGVATGTHTVSVPTSGKAYLYVKTSDDSTIESNGSVTATLKEPPPSTTYTVKTGLGSATVEVLDDEPTVSMSIAPGSIAEAGGKAKITVSLSRELTDGVGEWEFVKVPLVSSGGNRNEHWKLDLVNADPLSVFLSSSGSVHTLTLLPGVQEVELSLTAVPNTDPFKRTITIGYGTGSKSPTHSKGGTRRLTQTVSLATKGGSVSVDIENDDPVPVVSISGGGGVTEGSDA
ncbi:MAG: S8 family serine peptidase, partial [bacterium]|nr:S8 family serine peptidase [bacterium]